MHIFIVNGVPESGKTTMEEYCIEYLNNFSKYKGKVFKISTIDSVKKIAKNIGWSGTKTPKSRKFLSDLKDLLTEYNDYPYKEVKRKIMKTIYKEGDGNIEDYVFFIDCREPKEINHFKKDMNGVPILIRRPEVESYEQSNEADKNVLNYKYTVKIWNDKDLESFEKNIRIFLEEALNLNAE